MDVCRVWIGHGWLVEGMGGWLVEWMNGWMDRKRKLCPIDGEREIFREIGR